MDGSSACTGSTGHEDPGYPGQIIAKYDYIIKKGSKKLVLSMYRLGIRWKPFTSSKYEHKKSEHYPIGGKESFGGWARPYFRVQCRQCYLIRKDDSIQSNSSWPNGRQYCRIGPILKCAKHMTLDECIIDKGKKSQPYMQSTKIVGNYNGEIAQMIYRFLDERIPRGIVDLCVSLASGYWFKTIKQDVEESE